MIDVVFLLLVFFLLSANFRPKEGFLLTELPRRITRSQGSEVEPMVINLTSRFDGSCLIEIDGCEPVAVPAGSGGFAELGDKLLMINHQKGRNVDDPIKISPGTGTNWGHTVKLYDSLCRKHFSNIIFPKGK